MKKGDDNIKMTLNISGELFKLDVPFDDQNKVRIAEREVKSLCDRLKKAWPDKSDKNVLAMVAFQFARWYRQLLDIQEDAAEAANLKCEEIDNWCKENIS